MSTQLPATTSSNSGTASHQLASGAFRRQRDKPPAQASAKKRTTRPSALIHQRPKSTSNANAATPQATPQIQRPVAPSFKKRSTSNAGTRHAANNLPPTCQAIAPTKYSPK